MKLILLICVLLVGCLDTNVKVTIGKKTIRCKSYTIDTCGVHLYRCDDNKDYKCQTDLSFERI